MSVSIKSAFTGDSAKVNSNHQLEVNAVNRSIQHFAAVEKGQAYQIIGTATLASGTTAALHIKNTSTDKNLIVTYVRHQIIDAAGGTAFPNVSNYFRAAFGRTYSSGGSTATAINMNQSTGNEASITAFDSAPILSGTALEFDRWYTKEEAEMAVFIKEGAPTLGPNKTIELSYVGDHTSGIIYVRLSFIFLDL